MYNVLNITTYTLYRFQNGCFQLFKTFQSLNDLLLYIIHSQDYPLWWREYENDVLANLNVTGNDIIRYDDQPFLRRFLIIDSEGRHVDPRIWITEMQKLKAKPWKWPNPRKYTHIYRQTSVAYTGNKKRHWNAMRKVKHYHRELKQDSIPEYQPYIRHKARIEDPWTSEPWKHTERNWKRYRKHQWKES